MDVNIAKLHISVHRADTQAPAFQSAPSRVERETNRAQLHAQADQQRDQVRDWLVLHGGH